MLMLYGMFTADLTDKLLIILSIWGFCAIFSKIPTSDLRPVHSVMKTLAYFCSLFQMKFITDDNNKHPKYVVMGRLRRERLNPNGGDHLYLGPQPSTQ